MDNKDTLSPILITYKQVKDNQIDVGNDKYGLAHYVLVDERKKVCLSNPFNLNDKNPAFYFIKDGDDVVGRFQFLSSRMKMGDEILPCGTGSALEVVEHYRKLGVGADIMTYFSFNSGYDLFLTAGISSMALPLYKALKYVMLEFPHLICLYHPFRFFRYRGVNKIMYPLLYLCEIPFRFLHSIHIRNSIKLQKKFIIEKEKNVPEWIDDIVLKDGHKYMEVHDSKWMQWNLDNCFHADKTIRQVFYSIKYKESNVGFFYLTERKQIKTDASSSYINGYISEWGTANESLLSESDIYKIALGFFSNDVSVINISTSEEAVVRTFKWKGFIQKGVSNIALKCDKKKYPGISDINQWRVRRGYADTMFFQ